VTSRSNIELGITPEEQKDLHKQPKEAGIRGRKSTKKLIQEIGSYMVKLGQIHKITDRVFPTQLTLPHEDYLMEYKRPKWKN